MQTWALAKLYVLIIIAGIGVFIRDASRDTRA